MNKDDLNTYAKRLQSRFSKKGFKRSLEQCRNLLSEKFDSTPTTDELVALVEEFYGVSDESDLAIAPVTEPPDRQQESTTINESVTSNLAVVNDDLAPPSPHYIQQRVDDLFAGQSTGLKEQVIGYVTNQIASEAQEVDDLLLSLREMELEVLKQNLDHHFKQRESLLNSVVVSIQQHTDMDSQQAKKFRQDAQTIIDNFKARMRGRHQRAPLLINPKP
ncbi:MAG: hypothetical protein F6K31_42710 [Symploca sp. SIO2G7]|nr:hypothetical protein [Symploca sp. SIO2G7]